MNKNNHIATTHSVNKFLFDFIILYYKRLNINSNNIDLP